MATLQLVRSGYTHKVVIVTYVAEQLNQLFPAAADSSLAATDDVMVAGVRVYPAIEGVDFARAVSTVALSADVVSVYPSLPVFTCLHLHLLVFTCVYLHLPVVTCIIYLSSHVFTCIYLSLSVFTCMSYLFTGCYCSWLYCFWLWYESVPWLDVLVAQRLGRQTFAPAVMGSIPGLQKKCL